MQIIKIALIFAVISAPAHASPVTQILGERALSRKCSDSFFSQIEIRNCLKKKANASEKALKQAEQNVNDTISKWDEDDKYISESKMKFAASSREFIRYRNAQCKFSASLSGGGAGDVHEMGRLACTTELNNRRAAQLRDAVSDLPLK